jgi:Zn-dependent protease with chaperone function
MRGTGTISLWTDDVPTNAGGGSIDSLIMACVLWPIQLAVAMQRLPLGIRLKRMKAQLMEFWNTDLQAALKRKSRWWMRGRLSPKIVVLPRLWTGYGAWTLFGKIYITRKLTGCPEHVRKYIIGHELGHLYGGHVYLQALFFFSYSMLVAGELSHSAITLLALALTSILYVIFVTPRFSLARECFADSVAVDLYGPHAVLTSSLWMARRVSDVDSKERQARLKRLRMYLRRDTVDQIDDG